jgi:hypothetical protein
MDTKDYRSFKLAIVADYFINPSRYPDLPQDTVVYEVLRDLGYGILKMPETSYPADRWAGYLEPVMDQAEEYIKRRYLVIAVGLKELKDFGLRYSLIGHESGRRKIEPPRLVVFSTSDNLSDREKIALQITSPL